MMKSCSSETLSLPGTLATPLPYEAMYDPEVEEPGG
jgi:hypothetical protein